jgi:hypothetical protein
MNRSNIFGPIANYLFGLATDCYLGCAFKGGKDPEAPSGGLGPQVREFGDTHSAVDVLREHFKLGEAPSGAEGEGGDPLYGYNLDAPCACGLTLIECSYPSCHEGRKGQTTSAASGAAPSALDDAWHAWFESQSILPFDDGHDFALAEKLFPSIYAAGQATKGRGHPMTGSPDELVESVAREMCFAYWLKNGDDEPIAQKMTDAGWQGWVNEALAAIVATLRWVRGTMGGSEVSLFASVICKDDIDALITKYEGAALGESHD